jgi:deoxyinosine 3'endonuclease (endonuclease V)
MDLESMQVVYEDFDVVQLTMPYVAGFLAFREVLHCPPLSPHWFQICAGLFCLI